MIDRLGALDRLERALARNPIAVLLGPRQCGKTTLAKELVARNQERGKGCQFFDCESNVDRRRLENPEMLLGSNSGLIVLDEIQALPELFATLRVLADRDDHRASFLLLGSASPKIVRATSESLAGRAEFVELTGFSLEEVGGDAGRRLWIRGGFPRSFLAATEEDSRAWREEFIRTFLERYIPQLGISIPAPALRRFWTMLAHYHGQTWNASELARSMGFTDKTLRSWLDILTATFMIRQLQPWYENIGKRQVKAPKLYFRDSGLLHRLLDLPDEIALLGHPKVGASWEGFALEEVLRHLHPFQVFFWSVHQGAELDLLVMRDGQRWGFEFKFAEAPAITTSMKTAMADLKLDRLFIVYPGEEAYPVAKGIEVLPLGDIGKVAVPT